MKKKYQIFISSTYRDLQIERQAAVEAILSARHIPAGMELFNSGDESQLEVIKRWIDESDIYMLILGGRYGSIEEKTGKSYVEIEYDYAIEKKKPIFSVIITDEAIKEKNMQNGPEVLELHNYSKYLEFRKKATSKMCRFFDDTKDIKIAIHESLNDFSDRHKLVGWVSAKEIPDYSDYVHEIEQLKSEVKKYRSERNEYGKRLNEISNIKAKESSVIDDNDQTMEDRIDLIFKLDNIVYVDPSDGIVWLEGEEPEVKELSIEMEDNTFNAYFCYIDGEQLEFEKILFVSLHENSEIREIMQSLRTIMEKLPEADMDYEFVIVFETISEQDREKLTEYFNRVKDKVCKVKPVSAQLVIWDKNIVRAHEDRLLIF